MEIYLTPEQESQLSQLAAQEGKGEVEVAREVLSRGLAAEAGFISAVKVGREAVLRGEFVEQSEVWAGVESVLQSDRA
jgi:predicted transcriptional regulator